MGQKPFEIKPKEKFRFSFHLNSTPLAPGDYKVKVTLSDNDDIKNIYHTITENILLIVPTYDYLSYMMEAVERKKSSVLTNFELNNKKL